MTKNIALPPNTLLHTFGVDNAIVESSAGTRILWNNTLGFFNLDDDDDTTPFANIEGMTSIVAAVDDFADAQPT